MLVSFECRRCSFKKLYKDNEEPPYSCPSCDTKWYRLRFVKEKPKKKKFVNLGYKDSPRWSWSMGIHVDQIPEMMKKYPNRTYHPKTGQLLVKNRTEKKKLMKEHGMVEYA